MILAAGRGERMRPLTDTLPKPMIPVAGKPLVQHHLEGLRNAGIQDFVINLGWKGEALRAALGDGRALGVNIQYSEEGWPALESGGGIFHALPLLGREPFIVVNGDVYADYSWPKLLQAARDLNTSDLAHLVMVPNPAHNPQGDFVLEHGRVSNNAAAPSASAGGNNSFSMMSAAARMTFSGLSVHRPEMFEGCVAGHFPMLPLWRQAADRGQLSGERYTGRWSDVGTRERLADLEHMLR